MVKDISKGDKFNMLTVIGESEPYVYGSSKHRRFEFICDCGKKSIVLLQRIVNGKTVSCGCYGKKNLFLPKHGMCKERIYNIRCALKRRCNLETHKYYKDYGGRGITYDPKRETFEGFYEDMKEGYEDTLEINRIDNNGNYCKENCKWSTRQEQMNNTNRNVFYEGKTISQRAKEVGISKSTINQRRRMGRDIHDAIFKKLCK